MSSRRPLSKAERSLFLLCTLALVPLGAIVFVSDGRDAEPNWSIPPTVPRPKPNGYDFYVAAAKATFRFKPEVDPASDPRVYVPGSAYALKNYSLARRNLWLKTNAKTFALFNQGLKTPSMAPEYSVKPMGNWSTLRQLARDISARSRTHQMAKQPMRATMSTLDGMQMAQDTMRDGGLIARLVGIAMMAIARSPLDDWNKTINSLSADEARIAARRLETLLSHEPTAAQTLLVNKRDSLIELRRSFATNNWRGSWARQQQTIFNDTQESFSQVWQRQIISKQTVYTNMNRLLDAGIANAKRPYSQSRIPIWPTNPDAFTQELTGATDRFVMNEARYSTSNKMLLLRLALRAYIAQSKTAAPALSTLVPGFLKAIPTDVYNDGKPLFYQPKGATYKLWSVGPDGINNGGVPLARRPGTKALLPSQNLLDNKGDFVAGLCR